MATGRARQGRGIALAVMGGIGAGMLLMTVPSGLLDMLVASSGLSEILPAAAPPLGLKARLLMAGFAAMMAVGVIGTLRGGNVAARRIEDGRDQGAQGAGKMSFALSRLTALARGRHSPAPEPTTPVLRRADAHPDAPPRPPIFASRDFDGLDIFGRTDVRQRPIAANADAVPAASSAASAAYTMPSAPDPLDEEDLPIPRFARLAPVEDEEPQPEAVAPVEREHVEREADAPTPRHIPRESQPGEDEPGRVAPRPLPPPTRDMSIAQLTDRLEQSLAQRARAGRSISGGGVIADMPVAQAVPVRDTVAQDVDDALRKALGALRATTRPAR